MKRISGLIFFLSVLVAAGSAQTKSSATIMQVVTAPAPIAATVTLTSSLNPAEVGKKITYSGAVTGTNNGASPTGTVTVVGLTGTQTVTLSATGGYTCSETPTVPSAGFKVIATYNGDSNFF
jgi:hypothetical protein